MFSHPEFSNHERVVMRYDRASGLQAIIAVHNTVRGPALGGCRIYPYVNHDDALTDVLRLSRGMTYKSAIAELPLGGGKMVIIGDHKKVKTPTLLRAAGRFVHSLNGEYITAEDVGMTSADCAVIAEETPFVTGVSSSTHNGDPSPATAYSVECAIKAAWKFHAGKRSLKGVICAIEGLGNVGFELGRRLHRLGAILHASDVDRTKLSRARSEFPFIEKETKELRKMHAHIYVPCALGGVINKETVDDFHVPIICGSANNILKAPMFAAVLVEKGIICVPDYVANCGGIIEVYYQRTGYDAKKVKNHIQRIASTTTLALLRQAKITSRSPMEIANELAEQNFRLA